MLNKLLFIGITGLASMLSTPVMAHGNTINYGHDAQVIYPVTHHHAPANTQHQCVWRNNINKRQASQKRRINSGIQSGQLTHWEINQLQDQQQRIRRAEKGMYRSGNCLSRVEIQRLNQMLDDANRYIHSLTTNNIRVYKQPRHSHHHHNGHRHNHR